jgi:xanthine dehydrogenase accessory factor
MSLNRATRRAAAAWLADGRAAVVVVVLETRGSAPRRSGTRMVVSASQAVGTVGGGHLERKAIEEARAMLGGAVPPHQVHYPLGPALGQCCGGAMTLGYTRLDAQALAAWPDPAPLFHLQLYGAGHVGTAIARLLATLDCSVDWIDEREEMFPFALSEGTPWPEHIRVVPVDDVWGEVAGAPGGAYYLVLTHSHDLDLRITETILRRGDFGYLGLIGSKTKRARFIHRFEAMGIPMQRIARMTCPIGIEGIVAKEPEIIAASVVAQLLQE